METCFMTYTYTCPECDAELEYEFTPGEPVKFCMNHDSPEFSNPGSGDEVDGPERCECGHIVDMDKVIEAAAESFTDQDCDGPDRNEE